MSHTHLSLFTGVGGLDLAAEMAGIETIGQCEWADYSYKVLCKHWPEELVPKWRDIHTLTLENFYEKTGKRTVDIISGGFPCQPFSVAGQRKGTDDDRYLWPEMLRVVQELKPTWFIGENVAGLVSMVKSTGKFRVENRQYNKAADADYYNSVLSRQEEMLLFSIIQDLNASGFEVQSFIVPACAVDAQHRRDRLAIVGYSQHNGLLAAEERGIINKASNNQQKRAQSSGKLTGTGERTDNEVVANPHRKLQHGGFNAPKQTRGTGFANDGKNVPYASSTRHSRLDCNNPDYDIQRYNPPQKQAGWTEQSVAFCNSEVATDPDKARCKKCNITTQSSWTGPPSRILDTPGGNWPVEPNVGRVANGVPYRVDRLKCLGNAVVPQQFYPFFKAIAEQLSAQSN